MDVAIGGVENRMQTQTTKQETGGGGKARKVDGDFAFLKFFLPSSPPSSVVVCSIAADGFASLAC